MTIHEYHIVFYMYQCTPHQPKLDPWIAVPGPHQCRCFKTCWDKFKDFCLVSGNGLPPKIKWASAHGCENEWSTQHDIMTLLTLLSLRTPKRTKKNNSAMNPPSCQDCQSSESNDSSACGTWMTHGRCSAGYIQSHFFIRHRFQLAGFQAFRLSDQVFPSNIYAPAMARPTSSEPWPSEPPLQLMQRPSSPPMCRGQVPKNLRKDVKKIEKVWKSHILQWDYGHNTSYLLLFEYVWACLPICNLTLRSKLTLKTHLLAREGHLLPTLTNLEAQWPMT